MGRPCQLQRGFICLGPGAGTLAPGFFPPGGRGAIGGKGRRAELLTRLSVKTGFARAAQCGIIVENDRREQTAYERKTDQICDAGGATEKCAAPRNGKI